METLAVQSAARGPKTEIRNIVWGQWELKRKFRLVSRRSKDQPQIHRAWRTGGALCNAIALLPASFFPGGMYALNASTGAPLWQYATGDISVSSPAVANGVVYVGSDSDDGNLYAFDLSGLYSNEFSPPERPDPNLLRPNWALQPSTPVTSMRSDSQEQLE
jgi:hypothetical protein